MMQINLRISRFQPETDKKPHYQTYMLDVEPNDRVLDAIEKVRDEMDSTLAYRRSCAHAICGSCAMRINGSNGLACKVLIQDLKTTSITLEPLLGLKVVKDLIVDMEPFFENYRSIYPYLINEEPLPPDGKERLQSPEARARYDETTKCILCAACTTACPSFWANEEYVGPAAMVNAHRFIYDDRDRGARQRIAVINQMTGIWRCRTAFSCTEACPRDIHVTQAVAELKKTLQDGSLE